jgi:hypothetical protein
MVQAEGFTIEEIELLKTIPNEEIISKGDSEIHEYCHPAIRLAKTYR